MSSVDNLLDIRPKAETSTVEDLVDLVRRGKVRIPTFQRGLRWDSDDVISLFDSIYKGYPIGSLLMRDGEADARTIELGPLRIEAPSTSSALWVIDGQQRLVSLTAGLARSSPMPTSPEDPYVVYFDARSQQFSSPPRSGDVPSTWVPTTKLLDGADLSEWIFNWQHSDDQTLRESVFEAGKRLRQYRIPMYVVNTDNEDLLRTIFKRINKSGKPLEWPAVYNALYGDTAGEPSTIDELAEALSDLGMGVPDEEQLLSCVIAYRGLDVTQNVGVHSRKEPDALRKGVEDTLPALRHVLSFFREHAEIPHLRMLPRSTPLIILTRFFGLHPNPEPRNVELLVRWTWRILMEAYDLSEPTLKRRGVTQIEASNETEAVRTLLTLVNKEPTSKYTLPDRFDSRSSESRLFLLGLNALTPRTFDDGHPINVASLIEKQDRRAFRKIWPSGVSSPANRVLLPGTGSVRANLVKYVRQGPDQKVLASHGISEKAADAILRDDVEAFIDERARMLQETVRSLAQRLAAWNRNDRPSINAILSKVGTSR